MAKQANRCGCLVSSRFHGVLVGLLTLVNSVTAITASVYLRVRFDSVQKVPEEFAMYYRYAIIDVIFVVIVLLVVGAYFIGICKVNEYYIIPFGILLLLDAMGYVASKVAITLTSDRPEQFRGATLSMAQELALYGYMSLTVFYLFRSLRRERCMWDERLQGYRSLSSSAEHIEM